MLKMLDKSEVPASRYTEKSELRRFAEATVKEFMAAASVGDVAEITGAPDTGAEGAIAKADKVMAAIRTELYYTDCRDKVKAFRRKERMFLERVEPWKPTRFRPIPYPDN